MVTGKPDNRIVRAYNNARFYKTDMSGKMTDTFQPENEYHSTYRKAYSLEF